MKLLRFYIALWITKLSIVIIKFTKHRGTTLPGRIALKICPNFLQKANISNKIQILGVTGTNGKTTTCNLLIDMLKADGRRIIENNEGSNTIVGLITAFVKDMNCCGKFRSDTAVLEIDERSSRLIFPVIKPDFLLVNNLTRDSIMRNGHPEYISKLLTSYMPAETKLILNGDDLIASNVAPDNPRVYFGIETLPGDTQKCINLTNDLQICPCCNSVLEYINRRYHHIGRAFCPKCGFHSPDLHYVGKNANVEDRSIEIEHRSINQQDSTNGTAAISVEWSHRFPILNDSIFNIYNVLAVVSFMSELGYSKEQTEELLNQTKIRSDRYKVENISGYRIVCLMTKELNAMACSRVFDYVSNQVGDKELILMINNMPDVGVWSENTCWLYDCDFELLNNDSMKNIIVTGPRANDYYLRLKFADIDDDHISLIKNELDSVEALRLNEGKDIYLLYGMDYGDLPKKVTKKIREKILAKTGNGQVR